MAFSAHAAARIYSRPEDVPDLQDRWAAAQKAASFFCSGYADYAALEKGQLRIAALKTGDGSRLILPFRREGLVHTFSVGERRLGRLPIRSLRLENPWLSDSKDPRDITRLLKHVITKEPVDLLDLGEIPETSALRLALDDLAWPARKLRLGRKDSLRWLIDLPQTFDAYLESRPGKERRNLGWKLRKVEKDFDCRIETFTEPANLEKFLAIGQQISRQTYQWNVGQQLRNDPSTLKHLRGLAEKGLLRCYLLYLDGTPRAFARGRIEGDIFHYDTPGYDPDFAKYSIGTVILLRVLQDLIDNSDCRIFDFGTGGDETGFKSRFGTRSFVCNSYYVLNTLRARTALLRAGQASLNGFKNLAASVIPDGRLKERIKRKLRKVGG